MRFNQCINAKKLITIDPKMSEQVIDRLNNSAIRMRKEGKLNCAIRQYEKAIDKAPDNAILFVNQGVALLASDKIEKAIGNFDKALLIDGSCALAYYNRAIALSEKDQICRALEDYTQAIRYAPGLAKAYNNRAVINYDLGNYDQAISDFNRAIEIDSGFAAAYCNRARAWFEMGHKDRAIDDLICGLLMYPSLVWSFYNKSATSSEKNSIDCLYTHCMEADEHAPTTGNLFRCFKKLIKILKSPDCRCLEMHSTRENLDASDY